MTSKVIQNPGYTRVDQLLYALHIGSLCTVDKMAVDQVGGTYKSTGYQFMVWLQHGQKLIGYILARG